MNKLKLNNTDINDLVDLAKYAQHHNSINDIASFLDSLSDNAITALGLTLGIDFGQAMYDAKPKAVAEDDDFKNYINHVPQFAIFDFHKCHKAVLDDTDTYYPKAMSLVEIRKRINKTLDLAKNNHTFEIENGNFRGALF